MVDFTLLLIYRVEFSIFTRFLLFTEEEGRFSLSGLVLRAPEHECALRFICAGFM